MTLKMPRDWAIALDDEWLSSARNLSPRILQRLIENGVEYDDTLLRLKLYDELAELCAPAMRRVFASLSEDAVTQLARRHAVYRACGRWSEYAAVAFNLDGEEFCRGHVEFSAEAELRHAAERGGVLISVPHLGAYNLLPPVLARLGFPNTIVATDEELPLLDGLASRLFPETNRRLVIKAVRPGIALSLANELRRGGIVILYLEACVRQLARNRLFPFGDTVTRGSTEMADLARLSKASLFSAHIDCVEAGKFRVHCSPILGAELSSGGATQVSEILWAELWELVSQRPELWFGWNLDLVL